ncbi:MAG: response regulator [Opitutaceae bacterium]|nr:response regulator [Opitutaceae bacterium]
MNTSPVKTILIVEDDDSFRETLRTVLGTRGFNVLIAQRAGEGLQLAACHDVDTVITNFQITRRNSLEICRALRG